MPVVKEIPSEPVTISISGIPLLRPTDVSRRLSTLIWGDAGVGKTVLAATAPGRKCWYNFDPGGTDTLAPICEYEDIQTFDLSAAPISVVEQFKNETNPLGILSHINLFDTFVIDSITNVTDKTLTRGISTNTGASIERPSPGAYGTRNALAIRLIKNMMSVTRKHNKHLIVIAHEGSPVIDEKTNTILHITLALGGQLPGNLAIDFSEFVHLYQVDGRNERRLMIRPARKRKPAKTRMWRQDGEPEFVWSFDADHWNKSSNPMFRLDTWLSMWNHFNQKLPLPGSKEFEVLYKRYGKEAVETKA